ncbi:C2 NT-type domain-containing protein [Heracleum sosnowskyi]|uniref:C2 NT-type domain-containing protein n=1 Tax=Heracleum sosnowskyi TaxID=360622 RepID=A0AAD8H4A4_9APIA|nr:C2 NT-type domain-containing protein [Heracleum sosnowskyi]
MVIGMTTSNSRGPSAQLEYQIHLQEIRPWPPSRLLKTLRSVVLRWEYSDKYSGSTNPVVPSVGSNVGDGKIQFNHTFRLPVNLFKIEDTLHKNCLKLNLFEAQRDKTMKGQLLATVIIDLAEYGIVKEATHITAPMNCKRVMSNKPQPVLFLKVQPVQRNRSTSLSRNGQLRNASMDKNGNGSVSALMNREYAEEAEIVSSTGVDGSSHSSTSVPFPAVQLQGASSPKEKGTISKTIKEIARDVEVHQLLSSNERLERMDIKPANAQHDYLKKSLSCSSSTDLSSDSENQENMRSIVFNSQESGFVLFKKTSCTCSAQSSSSSVTYDGGDEELIISSSGDKQFQLSTRGDADSHTIQYGYALDYNSKNYQVSEPERKILDDNLHHIVDEQLIRSLSDDTKKDTASENDKHYDSRENAKSDIDRSNHVKSVRSATDSRRSNGIVKSSQIGVKGRDVEHGSSVNKVHAPARRLWRLYLHACKAKSRSRIASAARNVISGLVLVAKACGNDVPRLTFWMSNVVVLRAILSQASENHKLPPFSGNSSETTIRKGNTKKFLALKSKDSHSSISKESSGALHQNVDKWEGLNTFMAALESVETWIFSCIVESIWLQILSPPMQSFASNGMNTISNKLDTRTSHVGNIDQYNYSLEIWKMALSDAYERICPIRAERHNCGCLHMISKLILEQCLARLDVAMFNAILRESADDISTDAVSDPITDVKVLPIPSGKSSFGAGAQLRTAIGIWSRWLNDQYGLDVDGPIQDLHKQEDDDLIRRQYGDTSLKSFHLLQALSDLMMIPKDMLLSKSVRKEVCPRFSTTLIRQILNTFVPDEYCPEQIPEAVFESLESEDPAEAGENCIKNVPCDADAIAYLPLSVTSVSHVLGDCGSQSQLRRTGSSVLRKSYISDDELDELESASCIKSFCPSSTLAEHDWTTSKEDGGINSIVRYQLLREVWKSMP